MKTRYYIRLPDPGQARGPDPALAFHSDSAEGLATELQAALSTPVLFERWRTLQADPEAVDAMLGVVDPDATVSGSHQDLAVELIVTTSLPGEAFKHRLRLLAGGQWQMSDVTAA